MCTFVDRMVNLGIEQGEKRGMERGMERGMKCGLERGEKRGMKQKEYEFICNMLRDNQPPERISKYTGQTIAYICQIEKEIC